MSISSPKRQCQSPRQNTNVNLLAKLPMSIPSPKCTTHEPLTLSPSRCPSAGLIQNCPTLGILRPLYLLDFDSHSAHPISARNTSIELYLARSATHRPNLSWSHFSLTSRLEVPEDWRWRSVYIHWSTCTSHEDYHFDMRMEDTSNLHSYLLLLLKKATFSRLLPRMSCWALARDSPRSR